MLKTLRTGSLTLSSIQYKFDADNFLTIKITASAAHKIYGEANITLANVKVFNIKKEDYSISDDYLNGTFSFVRTGATTLEYREQIQAGIPRSNSFITLPNNGSSITATIANSSFDLEKGIYNFLLLNTADSVFSTSAIYIKQLNLGNTGIDGIEALFYEEDDGSADPKEYTINNQDLTFNFPVRVGISNDNSGVTNIPLLITKIQ